MAFRFSWRKISAPALLCQYVLQNFMIFSIFCHHISSCTCLNEWEFFSFFRRFLFSERLRWKRKKWKTKCNSVECSGKQVPTMNAATCKKKNKTKMLGKHFFCVRHHCSPLLNRNEWVGKAGERLWREQRVSSIFFHYLFHSGRLPACHQANR